MVNKILNRISYTRELTDEMKIIYLYRYFSLFVTSFFYIVSSIQSTLLHKFIIITCLTASSIILNHLYVKVRTVKNTIRLLVVIETIGNILILIPSGGLKSPYILYSLNTVLIILYYLDLLYCLANLLIYLVVSSWLNIVIFNPQEKGIIHTLFINTNLILSFVLIIAAAQLLLSLAKKLNNERRNLLEVNGRLVRANERINESVEHIMALYQAINSFTNISDKRKLTNLITYYTKEITKAPFSFFYTGPNEQKLLQTSENVSEKYKKIIMSSIDKQWKNIEKSELPVSLSIDGKTFGVIRVKSAQSLYGVLGIEINIFSTDVLDVESINQLKFLSSLSSIIFERLELEEINEHLLVSEEQNRIAREIHDSICQRIFALSCISHTLKQNCEGMSVKELERELEFIEDSLNKANKELRTTIYDLSWKNKQSTAFQEDIESFIDEVSRTNNIDVEFNITGEQDSLGYDLKKALYRIICEGTGNAVRHGKCSNIRIILNIQRESIKLIISDNGTGFDLQSKLYSKEMGLGIKNIYNLTYYFNGKISIDSQPGKGTNINISLPSYNATSKMKGEVV